VVVVEVEMRQTFPAEASAAAQARSAASDFALGAGADAETRAAIVLCVSEAVTNAIVHAYRDCDGPGAVEVEAHQPNGYLCFYVRDQGSGMRPRVDSPGMGLGLPLISQAAAGLEFRAGSDGGTEVVMRFNLH
jgi:serine/threonine-protein kinase RsbW